MPQVWALGSSFKCCHFFSGCDWLGQEWSPDPSTVTQRLSLRNVMLRFRSSLSRRLSQNKTWVLWMAIWPQAVWRQRKHDCRDTSKQKHAKIRVTVLMTFWFLVPEASLHYCSWLLGDTLYVCMKFLIYSRWLQLVPVTCNWRVLSKSVVVS